jgi:phosphoesterase RecJ-like protein
MTIYEAGRIIADCSEIVLTTHRQPDGDGLGAEIALYHYLKRIGKNVRIINPDAMPGRYRFLDLAHLVETSGHLQRPLNQIDLVIVVDTGDYRRLGDLWRLFTEQSKKIMFLDHHPRLPGESPHETANVIGIDIYDIIDERSSSIGELLYRLFNVAHDLLDPHNASFRLSAEIALGLYVSIMTDTNSFRYARTTSLSHRIAADLVDYGLQPEEIYQNIYSTKSIDHLRLIGNVLSDAQISKSGKVAWVEITKELRQKYKATGDDTQTIVNFMLLLQSPEVLILIREEDDGRIKASLKSKGKVVVNHIAAQYGGGGHDYAAGFLTKGQLKNIASELIQTVEEAVKKSFL